MNKFKWLTLVMLPLCLLNSCTKAPTNEELSAKALPQTVEPEGKVVIYQAFTRLFGNKITTNKPWGTVAENGVGKFNDFNDAAFIGLKKLGVSHLWLTGVVHHAMVADYSAYGIDSDDPDVVKGRAGSPYAVKDYYDVNPDLALDPAKRLDEFCVSLNRQRTLADSETGALAMVVTAIALGAWNPDQAARFAQRAFPRLPTTDRKELAERVDFETMLGRLVAALPQTCKIPWVEVLRHGESDRPWRDVITHDMVTALLRHCGPNWPGFPLLHQRLRPESWLELKALAESLLRGPGR